MSPYDERNDGMAKNKPIKGSANAITETKIIVRRYFLVFSAETYTASIFCSRASIFCRISESSIPLEARLPSLKATIVTGLIS